MGFPHQLWDRTTLDHQDGLADLFNELDLNKDGRLDSSELHVALEKLGLPCAQGYIKEIIEQYDRDGDGEVTYTEFQRYVTHRDSSIRQAFRQIDENGDGVISKEEVIRELQSLGLSVRPEEAQHMLSLLDADRDGSISYAEFRRFVCLLPQSEVSKGRIMRSWVDSSDWVEGIEFRLQLTPPHQPLQRFLAGGVAGSVSRTVVAPLERLRTMMMADVANLSMRATLGKMWAGGGLPGLWRGNMATVVKVFPQTAIQYAVYDTLTRDMGGPPAAKLGMGQRLGAGCLAGAAATLATYPLETLRTRVTMDQSASLSSSPGRAYLGFASSLIRSQGVRGLYQGFQPAVLNSMMSTSMGFASYEALTHSLAQLKNRSPTCGERGTLAGVSALVVMTGTMPLEVVMRRLQIQGSPGYPRLYEGPLHCAATMWREEGLRSFYRGTLSSYMKVVPSIAAVRFLYELLVKWMGVGGTRPYRTEASH